MTLAVFLRAPLPFALLAPLHVGQAGQADAPVSEPAEEAARIELPTLSAEDLPRWAEHVRPSAAESLYGEIDWIAEFGEGLVRASAEEKPLLFWAMNGHPLGCT